MTMTEHRTCPSWCDEPASHLTQPEGFVDHYSKALNVPFGDAGYVEAIVQEYVADDGTVMPRCIIVNAEHAGSGSGFIATPEQALQVAEALIRSARMALEGTSRARTDDYNIKVALRR